MDGWMEVTQLLPHFQEAQQCWVGAAKFNSCYQNQGKDLHSKGNQEKSKDLVVLHNHNNSGLTPTTVTPMLEQCTSLVIWHEAKGLTKYLQTVNANPYYWVY